MYRRTSRLALIVGTVFALLVGLATPSVARPHRYRKAVTVTVHVAASASRSATVTASATVGKPPANAKASAKGSASARRSATATAKVRKQATASSPAKARARAAAIARSAARSLAAAKARALAARRALAAARALATARASASARAQATALLQAHEPTNGTGACGGVTLRKSDGRPWTCSFDDEFTGTTLDTSKWSVITSAANGLVAGQSCWVDSPDNIAVSGGTLNLTVRKVSTPVQCHSNDGDFATQYTTGQVATYGKFSQTYGRFAVRAKFPAATVAGLQSSLWMWPENNIATGLTGEIDIAEDYSQYADFPVPTMHYLYDPASVNVASNTNIATSYSCRITDLTAFHEYAVEWTPTTMTVSFDGKTCLIDHYQALGQSPFDQPYFLALSVGLGIGTNVFDPARTPLPATTQIDWVRAWK